jgi:septal ring factor EnvC (AmiA/AmiB activator)
MMEDQREPIRNVKEDPFAANRSSAWLATAILALVVVLGLAVGYIYRQQANSKQAAVKNAEMNATIGQMQDQIAAMTSKLNQAPAEPTAPTAATAAGPATTPASAKHRTAAENKRLKEMQAKLDDQQQQLKDTQDQVAQTRSDLEANLGSTREDLNGSIARTHDELVSLEQRGERSYFEFELTRAKHFQREGPIMVSLRKVDQKHKRYDLALVVDDNQISKKNVNLFEPVWINGSDMQQVQLVVNKVDKDHVHGYVSAPKYAQSASMTPVSVRTDSTTPNDTNSSPATNPAGTSADTSLTTPEQPQ